jgi:hypothetical protein
MTRERNTWDLLLRRVERVWEGKSDESTAYTRKLTNVQTADYKTRAKTNTWLTTIQQIHLCSDVRRPIGDICGLLRLGGLIGRI